jgi:hypothetical protein
MTVRAGYINRVAALATAVLLAAAVGLAGPSTAGAHAKSKHKAKTPKLTSAQIEKDLKALSTKVTTGKGKTFKATYAVTIGHAETFTFAQAPPKSALTTGSGSVIETGTALLFCSGASGATTCVEESGGQNPFASILNLFSATSATTFLKGAEAEIAAKAAGYSLSFSTATYAGQPSRCITYSGQGKTGEDCVTDSGLLDYVGTATGHVEMTSFSTTVPSSAFTPPSGATVETLPAGVSVP